MGGYVSGGVSYGAGVSVRHSRSGLAWASRASATGLRPAPSCLFVPFRSFAASSAFARGLSASCGWRVWVRSGHRCSPWRASPVAPAWVVKVALPEGVSASQARSVLLGVV